MHMRACEKQPTVKISSLYTSSYFFKPGKPGRCGRPGRPSVLRLGGILCSRSSDAVERDRVRCGLSSWGRDMLTFIYIAIPDYRQSYDAALIKPKATQPCTRSCRCKPLCHSGVKVHSLNLNFVIPPAHSCPQLVNSLRSLLFPSTEKGEGL